MRRTNGIMSLVLALLAQYTVSSAATGPTYGAAMRSTTGCPFSISVRVWGASGRAGIAGRWQSSRGAGLARWIMDDPGDFSQSAHLLQGIRRCLGDGSKAAATGRRASNTFCTVRLHLGTMEPPKACASWKSGRSAFILS